MRWACCLFACSRSRVGSTTMRLPIAVAAVCLVAACATNPATGKRQINLMSEAQEISAGQEADAQVKMEMGLYNDPNLQEYVSNIGLRLAKLSERPNLPWHYTVVDTPAINAFALPGGYIYITRGILPFLNDEAQLAGVLAMLQTLGRLDEASGQSKGVPNWLETHPDPLARVKEIQPTVQELTAGRTGLVRDQDALFRAVDGIIYGDNPDQGIVRGAT